MSDNHRGIKRNRDQYEEDREEEDDIPPPQGHNSQHLENPELLGDGTVVGEMFQLLAMKVTNVPIQDSPREDSDDEDDDSDDELDDEVDVESDEEDDADDGEMREYKQAVREWNRKEKQAVRRFLEDIEGTDEYYRWRRRMAGEKDD